jgi:tetratricopeptide (TPR) repeat protein
MAKKKRITRKQMKQPDEFITFSTKMIKYVFEEHKKETTIIGSILVALILIYVAFDIGYSVYSKNAYTSYYQAIEVYREPVGVSNADGKSEYRADFEAAAALFQEIIDDYSFSSASKLSYLYLGLCLHNLGETEKAIEALESYIDKMKGEENYHAQGLFTLARIYESENKNELALAQYERFAELPPTPYELAVNERKQALKSTVSAGNVDPFEQPAKIGGFEGLKNPGLAPSAGE